MEHLTQVTMPRSTGTQTRTFTYDPATQMVASESHPETGTTMYTYGGGVDPTTADLLSYKKDAKGQITAYTYDTYDRVLSIKKYTSQSNFNNSYDDPCQRVAYTYDLYYQGTQTFGAYGRVAMIAMGDPICYATPAAQQQFTEYFNYTAAGQVTQKRLQLYELDGGVASQNYTSYWDVYYTYDAFGQVASTTYPLSGGANTAVTYTVGFDSMQRPNQLSDNRGFYPVGGVQYNPANQPSQTEFQYAAYSPVSYWENRAYNANYQLVSINNFNTSGSTVNGSIQLNYNYTAGANNGQIASMTDNVLGQTVSYSYDALKRLSSATSASGGSTVWSQAYSYDGFGNLTAKTGSGWLFSAYSVNSANNRLAGGSIVYDANGNLTTDQNGATYTYDVANRMVSAVVSGGTETYAYDAENKRISKISASGGQTIYIYGAFGEKLAVAAGGGTAGPQNSVGQGGTGPSSLVSVNNVYFAGRLIKQGADASGHPDYYASVYTNVAVDRLGSVLTPVNGQSTPPASTRYLPFGEELAATGNDVVKFATYTRDGSTGLDYADQRFYTSQFGRFMSADRFRQAAKANDSGSWNKYSYVQNDPISWIDPAGRFRCNPATCGGTSGPETGGSGSGGDGDGGAGGGSSGGTNCTDLRSRTWSPECHDPVEGEGEASPTAPTLVGAAGSLQTLFATAWGGAWNDVGSQKCASDFGKSTSWLQTTLMTANWIYGPITNQDGTASANMASAQVGGNTVTINSLSGFATLQNGTSNWYGNSVNMQATSDQERTFLILHELAHLAGQGASIDANNYNNSFSKAILTDCMGINLK
jgi:RHS repeat-associated protein